MDAERIITRIEGSLKDVQGVTAVVLGGSRAKGTHTPKSDIDIGLYYESEAALDLGQLASVATALDDTHRESLITAIGGWGPWVNAGGWLTVEGMPVDFILRDIGRVSAVIDDCLAGHVTIDYHPGHPHGFVNAIYMAETALCKVLRDTDGRLSELKAATSPYPAALKQAIIDKFLWEASFTLVFAGKSVPRRDAYHAAGCCFRAVSCLNQVLFAVNERYWMNETGALDLAAALAAAPARYKERINEAFTLISAEPGEMTRAIDWLREIVEETTILAVQA